MNRYIDGFAFPIANESIEKYKRLASSVADIWKEHGALDYQEYLGDAMQMEGTSSFVKLLAAKENEVVIFGWVTFESRQARDKINALVAADPRMEELVNSIDAGFDPKRMAFGGFKTLINCAQ